MAHVLRMPTFQLGDPVTDRVLMETDDFPLHSGVTTR